MIPVKLTADISNKYKVSIRLSPDGLSFWGYIPSEKDSFFMQAFPFDYDFPTVESLKNIVFNNPCFSFIYHSFHVICVGAKFTLTPDPVYVEKEKDRLFDYCFPHDPSLKTLVQPIQALNASIMFGIDKDVFAFLMRSLTNPLIIHSLSPLLTSWQKKSILVFPKLMLVDIRQNAMDVLCFEQGNLLFANSYNYDTGNDIIYYILYICKQTSFNQLEDCLTISGVGDLCRNVLPVISKYVRKTDYLQQQITDYQVASDIEPTLDMITLMECGL